MNDIPVENPAVGDMERILAGCKYLNVIPSEVKSIPFNDISRAALRKSAEGAGGDSHMT